jgi:hypothetical protein
MKMKTSKLLPLLLILSTYCLNTAQAQQIQQQQQSPHFHEVPSVQMPQGLAISGLTTGYVKDIGKIEIEFSTPPSAILTYDRPLDSQRQPTQKLELNLSKATLYSVIGGSWGTLSLGDISIPSLGIIHLNLRIQASAVQPAAFALEYQSGSELKSLPMGPLPWACRFGGGPPPQLLFFGS